MCQFVFVLIVVAWGLGRFRFISVFIVIVRANIIFVDHHIYVWFGIDISFNKCLMISIVVKTDHWSRQVYIRCLPHCHGETFWDHSLPILSFYLFQTYAHIHTLHDAGSWSGLTWHQLFVLLCPSGQNPSKPKTQTKNEDHKWSSTGYKTHLHTASATHI